MSLAGKRAIVTGAAGGIGSVVARRLAGAGAALALADLKLDAVEAVAAELRAGGAEATAVALDLSDLDGVGPVIDEAAAALGGVDILVNNAGIGVQGPILEHTVADFERVYRINVFGLFATLKAAAARMVDQGQGGRIVNIASTAGMRGLAHRAAYGSSKAAVVNLTQVAAVELAPHRITVNAISPGPIETEMVRHMHPPATRAPWLARIPAGHYGEPEDVADAVFYLVGPGAGFVTGHVLCVDGGFTGTGLILPEERGAAHGA